MSKQMMLGTLTMGAFLLAGVIGIITVINEAADEAKQIENDEINGSPIGI
jgi:hypothetical protein